MNIVYKIVVEWAAPTYYDYENNTELYDECDASPQRLWVVSYDPDEKEIVEWLEEFYTGDVQKAKDYIEKLKLRNMMKS